MGKLKDEVKGEMLNDGGDRVVDTGFGGYIIWPLRVVVFLKIGDLL